MSNQAVAYFKYLKSIGVDYVDSAKIGKPVVEAEVEATKVAEPAAVEYAPCVAKTDEIKETEVGRKKALPALAKDVSACTACSLHKTKTNTVFGSGDPKAGIMFIGEAPGADEDKQGLPFVGRAGKLLTKMIQAIGYEREEVYIANVLKCRPPENRPPLPEEKEACEHFLINQIEQIKPSVICALGTHAAHTLLKTKVPIGRLRGIFNDYHGVPLLPTYHPSFLNRSPQYKKLAWEDLQLVRDKYQETAGNK